MTATDTVPERLERLRTFEAVLRRDVRLVVEATLDAVDAGAPHWRRGVAGPLTRAGLLEAAEVFDARLDRLLQDRFARLREERGDGPAGGFAVGPADRSPQAFLAEYQARLDTFLRTAIIDLGSTPCPPRRGFSDGTSPVVPADGVAPAGDVSALVQHLQSVRRRLAPDAEDLSRRH